MYDVFIDVDKIKREEYNVPLIKTSLWTIIVNIMTIQIGKIDRMNGRMDG